MDWARGLYGTKTCILALGLTPLICLLLIKGYLLCFCRESALLNSICRASISTLRVLALNTGVGTVMSLLLQRSAAYTHAR
jgi:hypothetical protein